MTFTLDTVARHPDKATYKIVLESGETVTLRPLQRQDVNLLADFLDGLSAKTRGMSTFNGYDFAAAKELCEAINKYDKLRMVIEAMTPKAGPRLVGLMEFSFDIPRADRERFRKAGIQLDPEIDCRFGPTLTDDYQGRGVGSKAMPFIKETARQFGKQRIILWGGVLKQNSGAIRYYEKHGFKKAGSFINQDNKEAIDMIATA